MSRCKNPTIYAFEPAPALHQLLKANCEAYGSSVRALDLACRTGPRPRRSPTTEVLGVLRFHADETKDREAIQAVVRNTLNRETSVEGESVAEFVADLTADRLHRRPTSAADERVGDHPENGSTRSTSSRSTRRKANWTSSRA